MESKEIVENWRETTGDYDVIAFLEKEKTLFLSLAGTINYDEVLQYVNNFFQMDYGDAGRIACNTLLENLGKLNTNEVLIFHLY